MKSMKKLVLAGLILLTSVMFLVGCKNDSVPEVPKAKLISISITPPTRTAYSEGDIFDDTGMVVTATYSDGESQKVTGWSTNFADVTKERGLNKPITVSYTEGDVETTDTFTVDVASYQFTETVQNYEYPEGKTGTASVNSNPAVATPLYKIFGDWPQTNKGEGVNIGSGTLTRGYLIYQVGSDGNYYVKVTANPDKYFKVEPIVWRVLNAKDGKYNESENPLLLAENILTGGIPYYYFDSENGKNSKDVRSIGEAEIYHNNYEHSQMRAFLNGLEYESKESVDVQQSTKTEYKGKGFLQTAFTEGALEFIAETTVDNSARSTIPNTLTDTQKQDDWNDGDNPYASETYTSDKIFLLSEQEATKEDYGFGRYDASGGLNKDTRIRVATDYAWATGVSTNYWWLRSPHCKYVDDARLIDSYGYAHCLLDVESTAGGIVPALCIKVQ